MFEKKIFCLPDAGSSDRESSLELIKLDISRTFPHLCIFQQVSERSSSTPYDTDVFKLFQKMSHSSFGQTDWSIHSDIIIIIKVNLTQTFLRKSVCMRHFVPLSSSFLCSSSGRAISWCAAQHSGSIHLLPARRWLRKSHTQNKALPPVAILEPFLWLFLLNCAFEENSCEASHAYGMFFGYRSILNWALSW